MSKETKICIAGLVLIFIIGIAGLVIINQPYKTSEITSLDNKSPIEEETTSSIEPNISLVASGSTDEFDIDASSINDDYNNLLGELSYEEWLVLFEDWETIFEDIYLNNYSYEVVDDGSENYKGAEFIFTPNGDKVHFVGHAWYEFENEYGEMSAHTGDVEGDFVLIDNIGYYDDEYGSLTFTFYEEGFVVEEHGQYGGAGVSFTGEYYYYLDFRQK